jgi:acyl-[acyl-carrier-protein]-phospholipid O-acyltransferase/long-chain-fatty-acid--[acyl-carrier-protein] ligase
LFWCQFFSAFNDNFLKTALVFLILFRIGGADAEALITLAGAVFIAPFFFLSGLGGQLADRYDKAIVARRLKFVEIGVAALAIVGFLLHSVPVLFVALFGFGVIAALFGPIKYGILPDHLPRAALPGANALVEGATFIAILTGTMAAGFSAQDGGDAVIVSVVVMLFALLCWLSSLMIPPSGEAAPDLEVSANIARSTWSLLRDLRRDARLWWGSLVTSWFWLVGIVVLSLLPPLIKTLLGGDEQVVTIYLALFSIAVGIGSALAAWRAHGRIVLSTTLIGGALLGVFAVDIGLAMWGASAAAAPMRPAEVFASARGVRLACDFLGLAVGGGLFIVPVFAAVQVWAGADHRARVVAGVNVLNALAMTAVTVFVALLQKAGVTVPMLFLGSGVACLLVTLLVWRTMPLAD